MSTWNGNNFSVYKSEEMQVLQLIKKLGDQVNHNTDNKTDKLGDHAGSWQGLNKPTLSVEGANAMVEKHETDIINNNHFVNVKTFGAIGNGVIDDTNAIVLALTDANARKIPLFFPNGIYIMKQNIIIEDDTTPKIFGENRSKTILMSDIATGIALESKCYYTRPLKIENMTIQQKDITKTLHGLKVNKNAWGVGCILHNVNIYYFTGNVIEMTDTYSLKASNCHFVGGLPNGVKTATILKISKGVAFSNLNAFEDCTFQMGKIGIDNLGGIATSFSNCDFENLDLFLHLPLFAGYNQKMTFNMCWFENITKGIINADMNYDTLVPNDPVTNKASVDSLYFINCYGSSGLPAYILNQLVEPVKYNNFNLSQGLIMKQNAFLDLVLTNGWTGALKYCYNAELNQVTVRGIITPSTLVESQSVALVPAYCMPSIAHLPIVAYSSNRGILLPNFILTTGGSLMVINVTDLSLTDELHINILYQI